MAKNRSIEGRLEESFVDTGDEKSIQMTLSGSAGTLKTITLPDTVKGFRLYPTTSHIRFAVYYANNVRALAAVAVNATGVATIAETDFAIGGIAKPDAWETRLLPPVDLNNKRTLTIRSTTANVVVELEIF